MMMNQERFDLIREVLSEAAMTDDERMLMAYRITTKTRLPPMQPLFKMFDTPCFYRGELVAACGKAKSGKTLFLSVIMAACLTEKVMALERHTENVSHTDSTDNTDKKPLRVLWVDTEQSQQSTQDIIVNRIIPLIENCHTDSTDDTDSTHSCQAKPVPKALSEISEISVCEKKSVGSVRSVCDLDSTFFAINLRGLGFEKRRAVVEAAVRTVQPDIVIIDGIKDLITDINDAVQATHIMEHLMALAQRYNCCIVNVLHQNKSEADRNMRGSIGTELTNKAFEVYECEYLERHKVFRVTQTLSRRQRMNRRLCYALSKEGLPETCDEPQEQPRDELGRWMSVKSKSEALVKLFNEAMEGRTQRKFNELMAVALKKCGVADAKTYYDLVKEAEEQGIIRKVIHPDTKESWVVLNDDSVLPF
jgi:KaiC/GvpD/RAD55 family RecA-like ATPase